MKMVYRTRETITRSTVDVSYDRRYVVLQVINDDLSPDGEMEMERRVETRILPPSNYFVGIRLPTIEEGEILAAIEAREERMK